MVPNLVTVVTTPWLQLLNVMCNIHFSANGKFEVALVTTDCDHPFDRFRLKGEDQRNRCPK